MRDGEIYAIMSFIICNFHSILSEW